MLRLEWVEEQIERVKAGTCTMQTVRDYALLCIARDNLRGEGNSPSPVPRGGCDLDCPPTLDQVERALGAVVVYSDAEKKRKQDAMTWAKILNGEE